MALLGVMQISYAQEKEGYSTEPAHSATFLKNGFWDNWFIGAGAGANIYFGDNNKDADFFNRFTVTPEFQVGKWISPYLGTRIKAAGLTNLHTFNDNASIMSRNRYASFQANLMWSITDYFMKYSSDRVYRLIPYVGFGWAFGWDYANQPEYAMGHTRDNSMTLNAGIINNFKLSNRVTLSIEFAATALKSGFNQVKTSGNYDILGTASAGLIFNLGKTATFSEAELRNPLEIEALNNTINELHQQNQLLAQRPVSCPECPPSEIITEKIVETNPLINNVVLFKINQTKVDPYQGGHPGHAVIVVDMAVHPKTKKKVFLLAQSYMPAQHIHILTNPVNRKKSPWYELSDSDDGKVYTPEWIFNKKDLKQFK